MGKHVLKANVPNVTNQGTPEFTNIFVKSTLHKSQITQPHPRIGVSHTYARKSSRQSSIVRQEVDEE